ncbi:MAG: hypothetical protein IT537_00190 [Hyphomicrobiales bacterium]|nr:hypothetical protein [Hyphomicrobiales bacterium]
MSLEAVPETIAPKIRVVGALIRYGFYLVAGVTLGGIGLIVFSLWGGRLQPIDASPAFRLATPALSQLPLSGHVVSGRIGRVEVRQYGRLTSREADLALVAVMPPRGIGMGTEFVQDLRDINVLRNARAVMGSTHYDLDTRFGEFRATEMRVDTDGRWKQCLAYRSRLDTPVIYFTGWYCDGSGAKPSPGALACMLDRLVLDSELASKEADQFLRSRMTRSPRCSSEPVTQTTDVRNRQRPSPPARWSQPAAAARY